MLDYINQEVGFSLKQPIFVWHEKEDVVSSIESQHEIINKMSNASLQILEGVNHFPPTEKAEEVSEIIRSFYENVEK